MSNNISKVPAGSGKHPVVMVTISANALDASAAFYKKLFGWQMHAVTPEIVAAALPAGPHVSLRANTPANFPGMVPFIRVDDVDVALRALVAAGGTIERPPWTVPMAGTLARFADPSGTMYGLIAAPLAGEMPRMAMPFGANQKPAAGTVCSLEMYAQSGVEAAAFFGRLFGWGALETMPQYVAFDPGAGVPGVFQSHTASLPAVAYIYVDDAAAKLDEIDAAGGRRTGDAMAIPGMATFGYFKDPSGSTMGLIGP